MPKWTFSLLYLTRTAFLLWVVSATAVISPYTAHASDAVIKGEVEVDVIGKDAVDARSRAMSEAEGAALKQLLERFTSPQQAQAVIASLPASRISAMVQGVEVLNERISDRRYRAHMLVSFDGEEINKLINTASTDGSTVIDAPPSTAFGIIPIYEEGPRMQLWETDNPWLATWKTIGLEANSEGIVVPYGDNTDQLAITARNAGAATFSSLTSLTNRYGISQVIIVQAKFEANPQMKVNVVKRRISRTQNEINMISYVADPDETKEMLLTRAAQDIVFQLQKMKERMPQGSFVGGERHNIMMLASISTMASWTDLKAKLTSLPLVEKVNVLAISPQQVDMDVHYRGTEESLETAIAAQHLRLVKHTNYWVISRD
jgi:hypothetical protein